MTMAMVEEGLEEVDKYVALHQNTILQFIANRLIMDLCLEADRRPGLQVFCQWWEQVSLDLKGISTAAGAA